MMELLKDLWWVFKAGLPVIGGMVFLLVIFILLASVPVYGPYLIIGMLLILLTFVFGLLARLML